MEMRFIYQRIYLSRCKRLLLLSVCLCVLLGVHFLSSHESQVTERAEIKASTPTHAHADLSPRPSNQPITPTPKIKPEEVKARQEESVKTQIFETMRKWSTRELQKLSRLYESFKNPKIIDKYRMLQALQSLKISLLEEVSGKIFQDIMKSVRKVEPISSLQRPPPLQVIIATTWRSGSTFVEELLASHPGVYNHYEPLIHMGLRQIRGGEEARQAQALIKDLLNCRYSEHETYLKTAREIRELVARNKLVWRACSNDDLGDGLCYSEAFLSEACSLYTWSAMKLVRLRLRYLEGIMADEKQNVKVIYLVRDPRGVMNSRSATVAWCDTPDCNDPALLCSDMKEDLSSAQALTLKYPGRLILLRYEDLALNPVNKTRDLLQELGLDFDTHIQEFLDSHTNKNVDKPWSTSRDSKTRVVYWASKLNTQRLKEIQSACGDVMAQFGYLKVNDTKGITVDKVLGDIPLFTLNNNT